MSFHFLNDTTTPAYADTGPGTIIVDPRALIYATAAATHALTLSAGPWTLKLNGTVLAQDGGAVVLEDQGFSSEVKIGLGAKIGAGDGDGIHAAHATNISNAGYITATFAGIYEFNGNFSIHNLKAGSIGSNAYGIYISSAGTHTIINAGRISAGQAAISAGDGVEIVTNSGKLIGNVFLGEGNDIFTNFAKVKIGAHKTVIKNGSVDGVIDFGAGDDHFFGGNSGETVYDFDGKDSYKLGGGNDYFYGYLQGGGDLTDVVNGGKGIDTYDASQSYAFGVFINLDTVDHFGFAAMTADDIEQDVASARETIRNFENANGSDGSDVILGSGAANQLFGGSDIDSLTGFGGRDYLTGGTERDFFIFTSLKDSGPTKASRDTITDFEGAGVAGGDVIDLNTLNTKLGDIINFLGTNVNFGGNAGDLRAVWVGNDTILQLDKDGDKDADFSIALGGHHALTSGDFIF
jgi:Ca2+-binding RTX toxin-like protein